MDIKEDGRIVGSSWDGSLSRSEFNIAASAFAKRWNRFNSALPKCSWVPSPSLPWLAAATTSEGEGYLSMDNAILPCVTQESTEPSGEEFKEDLSCSDNDCLIDVAMLAQKKQSQESCHYDLHIVYSTSYRVPVLYFRAYTSDGQPLGLDEIEKNIPANSVKVLTESKWTFISQEDHPYLNRPWYTLHPCGTREWMKMLLTSERPKTQDGVGITKYLVSWFSVVGQLFGLKIPLEMLGNLE